MNNRANEFRKRNVKQAVAQTEQNTQVLQQMQQMVYGMSYKQFELENKLKRLENVARISDYRSLALTKLLSTAGISESQVVDKIMELQEADFDENSAVDDSTRGLITVTDQPAELGNIAITTIRLFKDGTELKEERIVRSKIELGKKEIFNGLLDDAVLGLKTGESKNFALVLGDKVDTALVTLLGLRKFPPAPVAAETTAETPSSNEGSATSNG